MAQPSRRFRRLGRPSASASGGNERAAGDAGATGDLFAHFGVDVEPDRAAATLAAPVQARPCRTCRWYVTAKAAVDPCPICHDLQPWGDAAQEATE